MAGWHGRGEGDSGAGSFAEPCGETGMNKSLRASLMAISMAMLMSVSLTGCGYHLVGHGDDEGGAIPADVQLLALVSNAEPGLLVQLRQRLQSDRYAIVEVNGLEANKPANEAHFAILQVNIAALSFTPSTYDAGGIATQYRMIFSGSLLLEKQGQTIWRSGLIQRQGDVFVSSEPTGIEASRERLLADLSKQWLSDAVGRIRSGF
ncbi:MAG: adenosylmethionine-8-amino-7-oxononanoate aminotransferase [Mariprofundus sp.]|nr:adenosylmethionine-8-amino-7-oxononanoate aminotransferase [Mariprofundus sp.]